MSREVFLFVLVLGLVSSRPGQVEEESDDEEDEEEYEDYDNSTHFFGFNSSRKGEYFAREDIDLHRPYQYLPPGYKPSGQLELLPQESFVPVKKKRKRMRHLLPLLIQMIEKLGVMLPVAKLTLLALFALVLFAKKAMLVSIGSLILVLYDSFMKKGLLGKTGTDVKVIKSRESYPEETSSWSHDIPSHIIPPVAHSRVSESELRRWWAPQVKPKHRKSSKLRDQLFRNLLQERLDNLFPQ